MKKLIALMLTFAVIFAAIPAVVVLGDGQTTVAYGHLDSDGEITVADALAVLRFAAKLATPTTQEKQKADVDLDGKVTVSDALLVLRVAAKLASANTLGIEYKDPPNVTPEV